MTVATAAPVGTTLFLEQAAEHLRTASEADISSVLARGRIVLELRSQLMDRGLINWCNEQRTLWHSTVGKQGFRESYSTLTNYRQAYQRFGLNTGFKRFEKLSLSKLYELAAPSFPAEQVQAEIDAFVARQEADVPPVIDALVASGELGERKAKKIAQVLTEPIAPVVKDIAYKWGYSDPEVIPLLDKIADKTPDLAEEIFNTGHLQGSDNPIPIIKANYNDVYSVYVEKRVGDSIQNWAETREVILQHYPIDTIPSDLMLRIQLPESLHDSVVGKRGKGGKFYMTITYVEGH